MWRGLRVLTAGAILSACGPSSSGPPPVFPGAASSALSGAKTSPPREQIIIGCVPCAIYAIDIDGRRASFVRADSTGRATFSASLRPRAKVTLSLYRRFPCPSH